jgi:exodeoxyribonuclease-1
MAASLFFYDLETSGFSPREQRIMQFAGQRTDMGLQPIGEPHNYLIKLSDDVLPDPDAVLLTGITPQMTITDGLTEAGFLKVFTEEIAIPGTVFLGFNSVRFDDEFMRFLHYRNFYDAYEWHWADGRGRWDLLDVVRMTRALRPEGIKWPVDSAGKPANRLELLASINGLDHAHAHDALSDVQATIAVAQLIRGKQPKLFNYLLDMRDKKNVSAFVQAGQPFVYTSGKFASEYDKTTVTQNVCDHSKKGGAVVFDLRYDPADYVNLAPAEIAQRWTHFCREKPCPHPRIPLKTLQFNRCPAVAPLGVLTAENQKRLDLDIKKIEKHSKTLASATDFCDKVLAATGLLDKEQQARLLGTDLDADGRLYDAFVGGTDKTAMRAVQAADKKQIADLQITFQDERLQTLWPLYKARNFGTYLTDEERTAWERFRKRKLLGGKGDSRAARYFKRLAELAEGTSLSDQKRYLLEELQLYGQSILPVDEP